MVDPVDFPGAVAAFVRDVGAALRAVAAELPGADGSTAEADAANDAFNLTAAMIDVDHNHRDGELWPLIRTFARWVPSALTLASPEDVRKSGLVVGKAAWLDTPSALFEVLVAADAKHGTAHARTYYERALPVAMSIAALDAQAAPAELHALDALRQSLLGAMKGLPTTPAAGAPATTTAGPTPAPPAAGDPKAPPAAEPPARPLEQVLAELDQLVGLAEVKTEVRLVTNLLQVQKLRKERGLPVTESSRHLVFTGNPGTGKTTVARLLAEIYRSLGVVATGQLVETDRSGLVSGYVGQTALKVTEVFDRAEGGVLLIDEAYALARGGANDFGREAIDTIVKLIEDRRDSVVVIAAGYPDEMATFIDANPGLSSRFPKTIEFPDYTDEELWSIFRSLGDKAGYRPDAGAERAARAWLADFPRTKGFGNGRLARNLFEDAVARQASRIVQVANPTDEQLCTLTEADIAPVGEGPGHDEDPADEAPTPEVTASEDDPPTATA